MSRRAITASILITLALVLAVFFALWAPKQEVMAEKAQTTGELKQQATEDLHKVNANLSQVQQQQNAEREAVMAELAMPEGYHYSNGENFDSLTAQSEALESRLSDSSANPKGSSAPELVKYEDGFFAASAASDWQCAWLMEAVKHSKQNNFHKVDSDIATLESFKEKSYIQYFPDYEVFLKDAVYPLKKGDTVVAQSFIDMSCSITQPQ